MTCFAPPRRDRIVGRRAEERRVEEELAKEKRAEERLASDRSSTNIVEKVAFIVVEFGRLLLLFSEKML